MKQIPLTKGMYALVDDDDFETLSRFKWAASVSKGRTYAMRSQNPRLMHRAILTPPREMVTDHINGDTLDNRRCNIRVCTQAENSKNRTPPAKPTATGVRGVTKHGNSFRVKIETKSAGVRHTIFNKSFKTLPEAASVAETKRAELYGTFMRPDPVAQTLGTIGYKERVKTRNGCAGRKYRGVYNAPKGRFQAIAWVNKRQVRIGIFDTETEAAIAYDFYVKEHLGEKAKTNMLWF